MAEDLAGATPAETSHRIQFPLELHLQGGVSRQVHGSKLRVSVHTVHDHVRKTVLLEQGVHSAHNDLMISLGL